MAGAPCYRGWRVGSRPDGVAVVVAEWHHHFDHFGLERGQGEE
jgi:hypothetical protein